MREIPTVFLSFPRDFHVNLLSGNRIFGDPPAAEAEATIDAAKKGSE